MTPATVVVGDVLIDELVDPAGSTAVPGGSALNVAVGLSVLGVPAALIGMVGDDEDGRALRAYLDEWNVPLVATVSPLGTGRAVSDRRGGEPTYRFNKASVNREIAFDQSATDALLRADTVAISGFPFDRPEQVGALADILASSHARIAIDANPRAGLLWNKERFCESLERLARVATLVKVGDEDADLLYDAELGAVVDRYLSLGVPYVLATAGRGGASVHQRGHTDFRPIAERGAPIVDTMGAGDATFAAALRALAAPGPVTDVDWGLVLSEAMAIAAETIRQPGALLRQPLPASG